MTLDKRGVLQLQIIRKNHERFQIDHILDIISEQGLQCLLIMVFLVIIPEVDGKISIDPFKLPTVDSRLLLTPLETTAIPKKSQQSIVNSIWT